MPISSAAFQQITREVPKPVYFFQGGGATSHAKGQLFYTTLKNFNFVILIQEANDSLKTVRSASPN